ncbi:hypothetical protein CDD83_1844 [Cordyceps sp. RAO-2017]|nr:hypothetical protein CDD83_1844 [Cordyceps sp. RAO-2017]
MRRNHENRGTAVYLAKRTFAQPNHRLCRSLRTVQGIDCLYSLRGLRTVRIFDYDQFLYVANREAPIRDTSFLQDVLNSVRQKKEPVDATKAKLRNLQPLIRGYEPDNEVWRCLRKLLSEGRPGRDDDEGSDGRRPESIIDRNSAANTGSDDDNDSESETGSGSDDGGSSSSSDDDAGSDDPDQGAAQRVRDHDRVGSDAPISFDFDDRAVDFHGLDSPSRSLGSDAGSQADSDGRRDERRRARLPRSSTHSRTPSRPESVVDLTESGSSDSPVSSGNAGAYGNGGSGDGSRESPLFVENFDINQHHSGAQNANNSPAGSSDSAQGSDGSGSSDGSSLFCSPTPYQGIVNLENGGRGTQSAESIDLTGDDDDDRAMARNMKRSTSIDEGSVKSETPKRRCLSLTMEEAVRINLFWEIED